MLKNILIIEDDKDSRELLKIYLKRWDYKVFESYNGKDALNIIEKHKIQIVLIDWVLGEISGLDISKMIREKFKDDYIYIILITGKKNKDDVIEAISQGVDDYLVKPFNFEELKVRIKAGERIIKYQNNLKVCYEKLYQQSLIDSLTGLYNRKTILEKLYTEFERAKRLDNNLSIIMADIDYFKHINDNFGHLAGDKVLSKIGEILKKNLRKYDSAGRYGGEEFLIILPYSNIDIAYNVADRIKSALETNNLKISGVSIPVSLSFGVSSIEHAKTPEEILKNADVALYTAKNNGRNLVEKFAG